MEPSGVNLRVELAEKAMHWTTKPKSDEWHCRFTGEPTGYLIREPSTRANSKPVWKPDESVDHCLLCLDSISELMPLDYLIDNYSITLWQRRSVEDAGPVVEATYNRGLSAKALPEAFGRALLRARELGSSGEPLKVDKRVTRTDCRDASRRQKLNRERVEYLQKNHVRRWQFKK